MQLLKVKNNVNKLAQTKLSLKIETCTLLHVHTKLWKQSNLKKPMELGLVLGTQRIKIQCHEFFPKPPPQPSARDTSVSIAISKKTFKNKQKQSSTIKIGAQAKIDKNSTHCVRPWHTPIWTKISHAWLQLSAANTTIWTPPTARQTSSCCSVSQSTPVYRQGLVWGCRYQASS